VREKDVAGLEFGAENTRARTERVVEIVVLHRGIDARRHIDGLGIPAVEVVVLDHRTCAVDDLQTVAGAVAADSVALHHVADTVAADAKVVASAVFHGNSLNGRVLTGHAEHGAQEVVAVEHHLLVPVGRQDGACGICCAGSLNAEPLTTEVVPPTPYLHAHVGNIGQQREGVVGTEILERTMPWALPRRRQAVAGRIVCTWLIGRDIVDGAGRRRGRRTNAGRHGEHDPQPGNRPRRLRGSDRGNSTKAGDEHFCHPIDMTETKAGRALYWQYRLTSPSGSQKWRRRRGTPSAVIKIVEICVGTDFSAQSECA
jgi:hypothetical protein